MNCSSTVPASAATPVLSLARSWWQRFARLSQRPARQLRLSETLSLGERRFVAVIEFEGLRFLVGGTSSSIVLLTPLSGRSETDSGGDAVLDRQELP